MDEPGRKINSVLFICTANRFRSPLASAIFSKLLRESGNSETFKVSDAGTWTEEGLAVTREALVFGESIGVDLSKHTSQVINAKILSEHQLVIVMEMGHKEAIISEFPEAAKKVYVMTEIAGGTPYDIPDPYMLGENGNEIANEIRQFIITNFDRIIQLSC